MASVLLREPKPIQRDRTGLFTSLPILWNESADLAGMISPEGEPHWARSLIEAGGSIVPLDLLATPDGTSKLSGLRYLVLAQARPLSPQENVALDAWVREGGRLLLFADPMLTEDTAFAIGDKRRPQDIAMVDPLLHHWGLRLEFDEELEFTEGDATAQGLQVPLNMPGRLVVTGGHACQTRDQGLVASCQLGKGRVLVFADAAVLERDDPAGVRAKALKRLLEAAFNPGGA